MYVDIEHTLLSIDNYLDCAGDDATMTYRQYDSRTTEDNIYNIIVTVPEIQRGPLGDQ